MKPFDRRRLIGAWELKRWFVTDPDGAVTEPLGPGAEGLLVFTADGWMTTTMTAAGRPSLSRRNLQAAPVNERAAAFDTVVSYCCRWRVVGRAVELQVVLSHNPAMVGTLQVRQLQMHGSTLTVFTEESVPAGKRVHRLQWRPARSPGHSRSSHRKSSQARTKA